MSPEHLPPASKSRDDNALRPVSRDRDTRERANVADALARGRSAGSSAFAHALALPISASSDPLEHQAEQISEELARAPEGLSLDEARLHTGPAAGRAAEAVNARAFTMGADIVFARGQFAPETAEGRKLLVHELSHVAQHRAGVAPRGRAIHRRPAELIDNCVFLGQTVGGGVNETLRDRLDEVQRHLQGVYDALGANHVDRVDFGGGQKTLAQWSGVTSIRGWRTGSPTSKHASGSAVDINYDLQPYIATRSQVGGTTVYGGEAAGATLQDQRHAATDVYDRAVRYVFGTAGADVSARRTAETTSAVYQRFAQTSRALSYYFRHAFLEEPTSVLRQPIRDIEGASEADLLAAIPLTERRAEGEAIEMLAHYMDADFRRNHPDWTLSPRETYVRMLRDYEHVRIPMERGEPAARPANTRNPTRGFLHTKQEVVEALVDVGRLRWGIADFGEATSGDVHHFDLGHHGGVTPDATP